ncbi:hypothetical protein [Amycolatopsis nigrescens]|uniref:hypothetical protein n=1 Tax=Amycolatopsis nigrescens TaxID=381445 RepID=UPI000376DDD2|nr:hypothetical protein [Amycolatopsis nigrescens]
MVPDRDNGLIPLRREYDQAWHGFDRNQVRQYLDHVEAHLRRIVADRDAAMAQASTLSRELENARGEINRLRTRVEELRQPPERLEDLDERMQRTAELANARAEEIITGAQTAAEKHWAQSIDVSNKLRERYQKLLSQLETHAEALHTEHQNALDVTKAEVTQLTVDAVQRREQLDAEAERKRRNIEREFDATMTSQRTALEKHVADQQTASKNQAERRLAEATAEAKRRVDEATAEAKRRVDEATADAERRTTEATEKVDMLTKIREQVGARLKAADEALSRSEPALVPLKEEGVVSTAPVGEAETAPAMKPPSNGAKPKSPQPAANS